MVDKKRLCKPVEFILKSIHVLKIGNYGKGPFMCQYRNGGDNFCKAWKIVFMTR